MCRVIIVLFLFTGNILTAQNGSFCDYYNEACKNTQNFYRENYPEFSKIAKSFGLDPKFVFAIGSPEVAWYSDIQNYFETQAVEIFYIQLGSDYSNFSLGWFQMKPSFVENIENYVDTINTCIIDKKMFLYNTGNENEIRLQRINRLKSTLWQFRYLCIFCKIMECKYPATKFSDVNKQLKFYAAAYNYGFDKPENKINNWVAEKKFPSGFYNMRFSYSEIALMFYKDLK